MKPNGTEEQEVENQEINANPGDSANNSEDQELDAFKDPEKALREIKKLRAENARHRTKNKEIESQYTSMQSKFSKMKEAAGISDDQEEVDPAVLVQQKDERIAELEYQIAMNEVRAGLGISSEHQEYFDFLVAKRLQDLEEEEELGDEELQEIARKVLGNSAPSTTGIRQQTKKPLEKESVSVQKFAQMTMTEKNQLFLNDRATYDRLFEEAKKMGIL